MLSMSPSDKRAVVVRLRASDLWEVPNSCDSGGMSYELCQLADHGVLSRAPFSALAVSSLFNAKYAIFREWYIRYCRRRHSNTARGERGIQKDCSFWRRKALSSLFLWIDNIFRRWESHSILFVLHCFVCPLHSSWTWFSCSLLQLHEERWLDWCRYPWSPDRLSSLFGGLFADRH